MSTALACFQHTVSQTDFNIPSITKHGSALQKSHPFESFTHPCRHPPIQSTFGHRKPIKIIKSIVYTYVSL